MGTANLKVGANNSEFNKAMQEMTRQMKLVKSEFSVAQQQAKLFGSETDVLKSKQQELTEKIKLQNSMLQLQDTKVKTLVQELNKQQQEQSNIAQKIEETTKAYKDSVQATGKSSEESKKLKDELNNLKEAYAKNERAIEASGKKLDNSKIKYNNLQKELMQTKADLKETETAIESQGKALDENSDKTEGFGKKFDVFKGISAQFKIGMDGADTSIKGFITSLSAGEMALGPFAFAVAGVTTAFMVLKGAVTGIFDWFNEVSDASTILAQKTGATGEELESLEGIMNDIYGNNYGESWNDVAEALALVKTNTQLTGQELEDTTKYALLFQKTLGIDVVESTRTASTLMKTFGITAEDAFNLLAQGQQKGLDFSGEMLDSINEYSIQMSKFGFSAEDVFNVLATGAESGAFNLDKVGDAVKELSIRVIDGSDTTKQGFQAIGVNADEMAKKFGQGGESAKQAFFEVVKGIASIEDPVARNQAGVNLFGTQWEDLGEKAVLALAKTSDSISLTSDSLEKLDASRYASFGDALEGVGRKISSAFAPVAESLAPLLTEVGNQISEQLAPTLEQFSQWIITNMPQIKAKMTEVMNTVMTVVKGAIQAFKWFIENKESVMTSVTTISTVFKGIINPLGLAIDKLKDLVGTTINVIANFDQLKQNVQQKWEEIKTTITTKVTEIVNGVTTWFETMKTNVVNKVQELKDSFVVKVEELKTSAIAKFEEIKTNIAMKIEEAKANFIAKFEEMKTGAINKFNEILNSIITFGSNLVSTVKIKASEAGNSLVNGFKNLPSRMLEIGRNIVQGIKNGISQAWNGMTGWIGGLCTGFINGIKSKFDIHSPSRVMRDLIGKNIVLGIGEGITQASPKLNDTMNNICNKIFDIAENGSDSYEDIGKAYIESFKEGINVQKDAAIKNVTDVINNTVEEMKKKKDKNADKIAEQGKELIAYYTEAINEGANNSIGKIERSLSNISKTMQQKYSEITSLQKSMKDKMSSFGSLYDEKDGEMTLHNIQDDIDSLEEYNALLNKLKTTNVSEGFMQQITSMDISKATDYLYELFDLSDEDFNNYIGAWEQKQQLAEELSNNFYKSNLESLDQNFISQFNTQLNEVPNQMQLIGQETMTGFRNGMTSKMQEVLNSAEDISNAVMGKFKDVFQIHSPSRKMRDEVGVMLAKGLDVGFNDEMMNVNADISKTLNNTVDVSNTATKTKKSNNSINYSSSIEGIIEEIKNLKNAIASMGIFIDKDKVGQITSEYAQDDLIGMLRGIM